MSRYYNMTVTVTGAAAEHRDAVKAAAEAEWSFDDWNEYDGALTASADGKLCAGETDRQFAERLARFIWTANRGPCQVDVKAAYLEDLPYEEFLLEEEDYARLMP